MKIVRTIIYYLSSKDRQASETIQRFTVTFTPSMCDIKADETARMSLAFFSMRNSLLPVNANNNVFYVTVNGTRYTVVLPLGAWTVSQIAANVTTALNAAQAVTVFTVTCNNAQNYYGTWTWTGGATVSVSFPVVGSAIDVLGFSGATSLGASGYVTPRAMSTGQEPYIQLRCSLPAQNAEFNNKASPPQTGYTDVLANIPILVAPFSQIIYQPFTPEMFSWTMPSKGMKLGTIEFYMTDHNGASITMVDDFDFSLRVDILRDEEGETLDLVRKSYEVQKLQLLHLDDILSR